MNKFTGWAKKFFGQLLIQGDVGQATPCLKIIQGNNQIGNIIELDNPFGTTAASVNGVSYPTASFTAGGVLTFSYGANSFTWTASANSFQANTFVATAGINCSGIYAGANSYTTATYGPSNVNLNGASFVGNLFTGGTFTVASTVQTNVKVALIVNQSGTAGFINNLSSITETTVGSGVKRHQSYQTGGTEYLGIDDQGIILSAAAQTTVNGATSGNIVCSMPFAGSSYKKVIIYASALLGAATYTFPTAFVNTPVIVSDNGPAASIVTSLSTTSVTITGTTTTGFILLEGY